MTDLSKLGLVSGDKLTGTIPTAIWPGKGDKGMLYPGTLGFIAGPSGATKSLASHKIMADWTNTRGHVILMDGEDGGSTGGMARKRAEAAGADLTKLHFGEFSIPRDIPLIREAIIALGGEVLLVWDTADTWIDAPLQKWGKSLHSLSHDVFPETGAIGIFLHHTLKHVRKGADWRAAVGGGTAGIIGKARFGIMYGVRPDESSHRLAVVVKDSYRDPKPNGVYDNTVAFEFDEEDLDDGHGNLRPVTYLRIAEKNVPIADPVSMVYLGGDGTGNSRGPSPEKAAEAAEWLREQLKDGAQPTSDAAICKTHGYLALDKASGGCPICQAPVTLVQGLKERAERDSISWGGAAKKALAALACESDRVKGANKGSHKAPGGLVFYWRLPDGHPFISDPKKYVKELT